jgi:hypothetical protein
MKNDLIFNKKLFQISNKMNGFSLLNSKSYRHFIHQHIIIITLSNTLLSIILKRRLFLNVALVNGYSFNLKNSKEMNL